jgi:hypothetical protein
MEPDLKPKSHEVEDVIFTDWRPLARLDGLKTEAAKSVRAGFLSNCERVNALLYFSPLLAQYVSMKTEAELVAQFRTVGKPRFDKEDFTPENLTKCGEHHVQIVAETNRLTREAEARDPDEHQRRFMADGLLILHDILPGPGLGLFRLGHSSLYAAVLIWGWTAFETMAADLWEAAVNAHVGGLSRLIGKPRNRIAKLAGMEPRRGRPDPSAQDTSGQDADRTGMKVDLNVIHEVTKGRLNTLESHMGTILRDEFSFISLDGIRKAYSSAFHEHSTSVDAALAGKSLDRLSAVRNVLVHSAGKADEEYNGKRDRLGLPEGPDGSIPLDGGFVGQVVMPAVANSVDLIVAVDHWLLGHQKQTKASE